MARRQAPQGDLIYSPDQGRVGPARKPKARKGAASEPAPPSDGVVRVSRETKGRKGKGVTKVTGVPLSGAELAALAKELKKRCGTGGTVKDGVIEIQGDQRDLLVQELSERGYTVKRAGG